MGLRNIATVTLVTSIFVGLSVPAYAKTKPMKLTVNKLNENNTYFTGKTASKANVKVTRYGITYATGKANAKGIFKLKAKDNLSGNWHYRVTAAKKGYKTVKRYILVKKIGTQSSSNKQVAGGTYVMPEAQPSNTTTVVYQNDQNQINSLNKQIADLQNQITNFKNNPSTTTVTTVSKVEINDLMKQLILQQQAYNNVQADENKLYNDNQMSAMRSIEPDVNRLEQNQKDIDGYQKTINDLKQDSIDHPERKVANDNNINVIQQNIANLEKTISTTKKKMADLGYNDADSFNKTFADLSSKQDALFKQDEEIQAKIVELQNKLADSLK